MRDLEDNDGAQLIKSDNTAFDCWSSFRECLNKVSWVPWAAHRQLWDKTVLQTHPALSTHFISHLTVPRYTVAST